MSAATEDLREAFRRRAIGAIERLAREASAEELTKALAAPTDIGTLASAAADAASSDAVCRLDPVAASVARGAGIRALLAEEAGGLLSATAVAALLGVTRAAVDKRRAARKLLAMRVRGDWVYPAAQFHDGGVVEGVTEVLAAMPESSPWSTLDFLVAPDDALSGRSPLDAMRAGDVAGVRRQLAARDNDAYG